MKNFIEIKIFGGNAFLRVNIIINNFPGFIKKSVIVRMDKSAFRVEMASPA